MAKRGIIRERIIRTLLNNPQGISIYRISKHAGSSYAWTHEFLKYLEKQKLIKDAKPISFQKLVNYWKDIHLKPKNREYMIQKPLDILKKTNLDYALTTYQAENLIQKYLFPSRTDIYIKEKDIKSWHKKLSKHGLVGKGNVRILITDDHVFYNTSRKQGLYIVSLPQLILDLTEEGSICEEAANMLLEKVEKNAL